MRTSPTLLTAALCALSIGTAYAQTATSTSTLSKFPNAMSFTYDALHDQINTSSVQLKPSVAGANSAATTGMIVVTIDISLVSQFPSGTSYHCSVAAIGGLIDTTNDSIAGGIETANKVASTGHLSPSCTLHIPYSWTLPSDPSASTGLILVFGVSADQTNSGVTTVTRSTLQLDGIENLPATGTTSSYTFNVTL